jgi:hypothetical protein
MVKQARITRKVERREAEGSNLAIGPGLCEVDETALDVKHGWTDGGPRGSAAMPQSDPRSGVASQALEVNGPRAS